MDKKTQCIGTSPVSKTDLVVLTGYTVACTLKDGSTLTGRLDKDKGRRGKHWIGSTHVDPRKVASIAVV